MQKLSRHGSVPDLLNRNHTMAGLHWLPISIFILLPGTFLLSFAIAVALGHVEADFPYISDTGTQPPESCIFGQLLNISAILVGISAYVRYRQVAEHLGNHESRHLHRTNVAAFWMGLAAALGISIVGNFQETSVLIVHLIGAVMAFGVGGIFAGMQTYISYQLYPHCGSRAACHLRAVFTGCIFFTFVITFVCGGVSIYRFDGHNPMKWNPSDGGFREHVISTASEWTMAASLLFFFLTFVNEFRRLRLLAPEIIVVIESSGGLVLDEEQVS